MLIFYLTRKDVMTTTTMTVLVPVTLAENKTEEELLLASHRFHEEFGKHQPGLLRRELVRVEGLQYIDIVQFRSMADAEDIMAKEQESPACQAFFSLLDANAAKDFTMPPFYQSLATY
jgi:hypothetical protein